MHYKKKSYSLNILIKAVIKIYNKLQINYIDII